MNLGQIHKLMDRKKNSYKGENGVALVVGGSEEYVTAPALAAIAALRAGCDKAAVAAPEKVAWTINMLHPDLITHKIPGDTLNIKNAKDAIKVAERYDAVLLGNGSTRDSDVFNQMFVRKSMRLKVVDADALKPLSFKDFGNAVLTPNWAELELLLINSGKEFLIQKLRDANVKEQAEILQGNLRYFLHNNNVLVVKGSTDIIISRNKIAFNRTGNQGMTKAGTGDILAGLCLGFLANTQDLFKSAVAACYINGFVGDILLKKKEGYSFIANDILEDLQKLQEEIEKLPQKEIAVKKQATKLEKEERLHEKQANSSESAQKQKELETKLREESKLKIKLEKQLAQSQKKLEAVILKAQKQMQKEQEKLDREKQKLEEFKKKVASQKELEKKKLLKIKKEASEKIAKAKTAAKKAKSKTTKKPVSKKITKKKSSAKKSQKQKSTQAKAKKGIKKKSKKSPSKKSKSSIKKKSSSKKNVVKKSKAKSSKRKTSKKKR